jgi:hypothetical protein
MAPFCQSLMGDSGWLRSWAAPCAAPRVLWNLTRLELESVALQWTM